MTRIIRRPFYIVIAAVSLLFSCSTGKPYKQEMMSVPEVMEEGALDPFKGDDAWKDKEAPGILCATNRMPAEEGVAVSYLNKRDVLLHLGMASINIGDSSEFIDNIENIEYLKNSGESYPLTLGNVTEFGPLDNALHGLVDLSRLSGDPHEPAEKFAGIINRRLVDNPVKDIFIYVHGVNTSFESPLLVASELWHYMGYRGVFIAFSWPSGQNILEYISDVDTAEYSAILFRKFLEFLRSETDAEKIHILAFSAGTKLVSQSLHQIGLLDSCMSEENIHPRSDTAKIGRVLFTAGDVERQLFGMYASDNLLEPVESLTVYMSDSDKALRASKNIRQYPRLGQPWKEGGLPPEALTFIQSSGKLTFVDVSGLEGTEEKSGHEYFRSSPWVSSDVFANLGLGISPGKRGLVLNENQVYWSFPEDYIERLSLTLEQRAFEQKLMSLSAP
jgi:esterase/lipase superfamily enzyme